MSRKFPWWYRWMPPALSFTLKSDGGLPLSFFLDERRGEPDEKLAVRCMSQPGCAEKLPLALVAQHGALGDENGPGAGEEGPFAVHGVHDQVEGLAPLGLNPLEDGMVEPGRREGSKLLGQAVDPGDGLGVFRFLSGQAEEGIEEESLLGWPEGTHAGGPGPKAHPTPLGPDPAHLQEGGFCPVPVGQAYLAPVLPVGAPGVVQDPPGRAVGGVPFQGAGPVASLGAQEEVLEMASYGLLGSFQCDGIRDHGFLHGG